MRWTGQRQQQQIELPKKKEKTLQARLQNNIIMIAFVIVIAKPISSIISIIIIMIIKINKLEKWRIRRIIYKNNQKQAARQLPGCRQLACKFIKLFQSKKKKIEKGRTAPTSCV